MNGVARMKLLRHAGAGAGQEERKQFFFEKKNQKTFANLLLI